jgi:hypothetical protein
MRIDDKTISRPWAPSLERPQSRSAWLVRRTPTEDQKKDLKWLFKECHERLQHIIKKQVRASRIRELRFHTGAFAKVVGTPAKLYWTQGGSIEGPCQYQ